MKKGFFLLAFSLLCCLTSILLNCNFPNSSEKSIIKNLTNDSIKIHYKSVGCFHSISDSLTVKNADSYYYLTYKSKTTELSDKQVRKLIGFENKLNSEMRKNRECTTLNIYRLDYNGSIKEFRDKQCVWNGWKRLMEDFNIE